MTPGPALHDLVELVKRAEREGTTVRAVGAGHSWSDVALTEGYLVEPRAPERPAPLEDARCARPRERSLVRVLGGTPLHDAQRGAGRAGLALPNMGGYDAQTISGAVSTSTHGSGLRWGPFPDLVRSLDLVVAGGQARPDRAGRRPHGSGARSRPRTPPLVQDDDALPRRDLRHRHARGDPFARLEVREKFWLNEVRTLTTWEDVKRRR